MTGVLVGGVQTDILVIDPATFARDAFWDERPIGMSLGAAMDVVRGGGAVGAWPVRDGEQQITYLGRTTAPFPVRAVDRLPASQGSYPTMLATRETVGELVDRGTPQFWVRGDPDEIRPHRDRRRPAAGPHHGGRATSTPTRCSRRSPTRSTTWRRCPC